MQPFQRVLQATAFFLLLVGVPTFATSFIDRPFPESVHDAPVILRGKIGVSHVEWGGGGDANQRLYTYYELQVSEVIKGAGQLGTAQIRALGGEKDGVGMQVSGSATFSAGEDVVVFVGPKNPDASRDIWGLMMGKFQVMRDAQGQEHLEGPGLGAEQAPGGSRMKLKWSLDALRKIVASQGEVIETPKVSSPTPSVAPAPAEAPQLQPIQPEGSPTPAASEQPGIPSGVRLLLGCMLGVAGFLLARWILSTKRS